jgi:flagellar biosynthesis protein FlhG
LMAPNGIVVTTPEIPAILNAYAFLKTAAYRLLFRSFGKGSEEREKIADFVVNRIEGQGDTFLAFAESLASGGGAKGQKALEEITRLRPRVVVNMGAGQEDANLAQRLREISSRNLGIGMEYISYIMRDPMVSASLADRSPLAVTAPDAAFVRGVRMAAERILKAPMTNAPSLELDDEDLFSVIEKAMEDEAEEAI